LIPSGEELVPVGGTISEKLSSLPEYFEYVKPVIEVQRALGGSAKPATVLDRVPY